jgi:hypothetical protein
VLLAVAAVLLTSIVPTPAAGAAPDDGFRWTIVPSSPSGPKGRKQLDYELAPREEITDWISVTNLSDQPLTVDLYPTDAFTAVDGGFALLPRSQPPDGVGSWITLPTRQLKVPVGKRADLPFQLRVPDGAAPGDHIGGIIASATEAQTDSSGQRVDVERRIAARVYLRVAGPLTPLAEIGDVRVDYDNPLVPFAGAEVAVTYRLANRGNTRLSGKARIQVTGPLGVRLANSEVIDIPELLPDSEVELRGTLPGVFPAGRLTATVSVNPQAGPGTLPALTGSASVPAVPWLLLGVLFLLVAALAGWFWRRRLTRPRDRNDADIFSADPALPRAVPVAS